MDEMTLRKTLAENLRRELAARGMSQSDLARLLGVAPARVNQILHAVNSTTVDSIERIAAVIGIPAASLLIPHDPHFGVDSENFSEPDLIVAR